MKIYVSPCFGLLGYFYAANAKSKYEARKIICDYLNRINFLPWHKFCVSDIYVVPHTIQKCIKVVNARCDDGVYVLDYRKVYDDTIILETIYKRR